MKRLLAVCLSFSLILVSAPPASWAQVALVGRAPSTRGSLVMGASVSGAAIPTLSLLTFSRMAPTLSGALSAAAPMAAKVVTADAVSLAEARREAAEAAGVIEQAPVEDARSAAMRMMDPLLGIETPETETTELFVDVVSAVPAGILAVRLASAARPTERYREEPPPPHAVGAQLGPPRSKSAGALKAIGTVVFGAAAAIGLRIGAAVLLPAIFGVVPVAAVWAVSSGLLLFPLALYARWRLSARDSARFDKVKTILDVSLGAFLGAVAVAVPSLGAVLTTSNLLAATAPLLAVAGGRWLGGSALADSLLVWGALGLTPGLIGVASAVGFIGLSPIIGLTVLPAMTTIAFFLGRLIRSAETDAPFAGGLVRGIWRRLTGLLRVLPDKNRNRQFWIFTLGQALVMLGANFHYTALPKLVAPTKRDTANLGYNRAINWGAQAAASLFTGPFVDRASTQKVLIWTHLARSLLMLMVPVLFFHGMFGFGVFSALIGVAGFIQLMGITAGSVALNRILDKDEAYYNRANAISTIVMNVVGVIGPLLAGAFIAAMDAYFGLLTGNALSYAVYAVLLLAGGVGYTLFLRLPRDEMMSARRALGERLKRDGVGPVRYAGVTAGQANGRKTLFIEVDGDPALAEGLPDSFGGFPVKAVARRRVFRELAQGFNIIFANRFLRLDLLWTTLAVMLSSDALLFAALPRFIEDVLKAGSGSFGLFLAATALGAGLGSSLMAFTRDPAQMALAAAARGFRSALTAYESALDGKALDAASAALRSAVPVVLARYTAEWSAGGEPRIAPRPGPFGPGTDAAEEGLIASSVFAGDVLAEGAASVGRALGRSEAEAASMLEVTGAAKAVRAWAARRGAKLLAEVHAEAHGGIDRLQRQWRWTSWLHGLSWLAYVALFFAGSLYTSVGAMLVSALLGAPVFVAWTSLVTKVVAGSYPESQGKIYSAIFFYELLCSVAGVLLYGWLMAVLPTMTVLWIASGVMVTCAAIDFFLPALIFPRGRKPAPLEEPARS